MIIHKSFYITITEEEQKALQRAEEVLSNICGLFNPDDCNSCPLYNICGESQIPNNMLYKCINTLKVEE